jgi:hypothetical protein
MTLRRRSGQANDRPFDAAQGRRTTLRRRSGQANDDRPTTTDPSTPLRAGDRRPTDDE